MAPMTRGRSGHDRIPNDMMLEYYVSRASAGLIITEGTSFSDTANGWAQTAAIETDEQVAGWKKITDAVHEKGGLMSVQLWHTGIAQFSLTCYEIYTSAVLFMLICNAASVIVLAEHRGHYPALLLQSAFCIV
jgi:2,4-dienoyl-CoA reductase-like NADH-dependent reductase (Old Yellow Enzyme family)